MEDMIVTRGMVLSELASAGGDGGDIAYVDGQPGGGQPQDVEDVQNDLWFIELPTQLKM